MRPALLRGFDFDVIALFDFLAVLAKLLADFGSVTSSGYFESSAFLRFYTFASGIANDVPGAILALLNVGGDAFRAIFILTAFVLLGFKGLLANLFVGQLVFCIFYDARSSFPFGVCCAFFHR